MEKTFIKSLKKQENGELFNITVQIPIDKGWIDNVYFNAKEYHYPLDFKYVKDNHAFFSSDVFLETRAIYHPYVSYLFNGNYDAIELDKISSNFNVPKWANGKIMYHIFVDRFNRSSSDLPKDMPNRLTYSSFNEDMIVGDVSGKWNIDFYGGDLKGITNKLDYISSLGVSILYLSPVVTSQSNHRYDTADFENVDPYLGSNNDLKELCDETHKRGIKVVLDGVFNHTGNDSKYYNEYGNYNNLGAFQSKNSKYYNFYRKNNDNFCFWWGMPNLPVCDSNSPEWINYITGVNGVIDQWFKLGIDGLRLDVADELSDNYIEHIRSAVKRNKEDGFIIGEVWNNPMCGREYISSGKGMDSVMNYYFIDALMRYFKYEDTEKLKKVMDDIKRNYPEGTINSLMNFTSTHDISRAINIFGSDEFNYFATWAWDLKNNDLKHCEERTLTEEEKKHGKEIFKAYLFCLTFLPGILSIFYGDELGVEGLGNLCNRKPFREDLGDKDLLEFFRSIGKIRKDNSFLECADIIVKDINKDYFMFERNGDKGRAFVLVNRTGNERLITVPINNNKVKQKVYSLNKSTKDKLMPYGGIAIIEEA